MVDFYDIPIDRSKPPKPKTRWLGWLTAAVLILVFHSINVLESRLESLDKSLGRVYAVSRSNSTEIEIIYDHINKSFPEIDNLLQDMEEVQADLNLLTPKYTLRKKKIRGLK